MLLTDYPHMLYDTLFNRIDGVEHVRDYSNRR